MYQNAWECVLPSFLPSFLPIAGLIAIVGTASSCSESAEQELAAVRENPENENTVTESDEESELRADVRLAIAEFVDAVHAEDYEAARSFVVMSNDEEIRLKTAGLSGGDALLDIFGKMRRTLVRWASEGGTLEVEVTSLVMSDGAGTVQFIVDGEHAVEWSIERKGPRFRFSIIEKMTRANRDAGVNNSRNATQQLKVGWVSFTVPPWGYVRKSVAAVTCPYWPFYGFGVSPGPYTYSPIFYCSNSVWDDEVNYLTDGQLTCDDYCSP
jgi:hypothetical protein